MRARVRTSDAHRIVDELAAIGCAGIVAMQLEHVRTGGAKKSYPMEHS